MRVNTGKKRIYVTMSGAISEAEARRGTSQVVAEVERLSSDFDFVADVSDLKELSPNQMEYIARTMRFLMSHGLRRAVRVVGKSARTALQLEKRSKEIGYSANLAYSIEEGQSNARRRVGVNHRAEISFAG